MPDYIVRQMALLGHAEPVGFGDDAFRVECIRRENANDLIRRNHYSKRIFNNSYEHYGVFLNGTLSGILQFGTGMNPASGGSVVTGTQPDQWLELNRMWMDDAAPRNSESRAIAYAVKLIRRRLPDVAWIQSFADERCGRLGVVYQAANFLYCGEHLAVFWELDGEFYHNIAMTVTGEAIRRRGGQAALHLQANADRVIRHEFRQFRYILPLKRWARRNLRYPVLSYPKPLFAQAEA